MSIEALNAMNLTDEERHLYTEQKFQQPMALELARSSRFLDFYFPLTIHDTLVS